jgi:catechol 2,3-dioxygenase-like lactoylglutathione lyase family enzyme
MAKINKVGLVVLNVSDLDTSIAFYTAALGMEIMAHNTERHMVFLSFGTQHHDIALPGPGGTDRGVPHQPHRHADRGVQKISVSSTAGSLRRARRLTDH